MAEIKDLDETLIMDQAGAVPITSLDVATPKRVAHYDLKREVGRGALSVVYEAEDMHTGQEVALKLLTLSASLTPLEAESLIARFEREARTAARLSHPNIVHIHEVGVEQNQHFLAMEYLKGQTLRKRIGAGTLTPAEVFAILSQIAGALDAVHKTGIVHRDVKPTNIILLPDGTAKLLDFGIARSSRETAITHRGMIVGSPSYMAPEQIKGDAGTKATDIWAMGVLSYEMLTGHLPFTGQNIGGVMFHIMHEAPAPMPDLSPAIQKVLLRALDKRPSQRYSTASAFVQALKLADPKQAAVTPEQKPAVPPKSAASFSLPGPKRLPEAALLSLFLLGFGGAYLARLHTDSPTQKAAAGPTMARSSSQAPAPAFVPASVPVPASAPAPVLPVPPPQVVGTNVPPPPDPAAGHSTAMVSVPRPAQAGLRGPRAALPRIQTLPVTQKGPPTQAKQAAAPMRLLHAVQKIAVVPAHPHLPSSNVNQAAQQAPAVSTPQRAAPPSRSAPTQVAARHFPVPAAAQQLVPIADRSEREQTAVQPVPAQSTIQAATLPADEDSYDPEAEARHRKSAWSQEAAPSQP